ncbi:hypothetical protein [Larsenimonas salina]|uniref:hypothetical protein n=1 Tax=Larsenimonas salina TaxID=1295565 RepID=UPI0020738D46|nr:hypothetical protein [Larsenimonas salina]MCM5705386.1 hypothetical protein [Larsenimonas salina]
MFLLLFALALPAEAAPALTPFKAQYALSVDGVGTGQLTHWLTRRDGQFESHMRARINAITGEETGVFTLDGQQGVTAQRYRGGYHLLGLSRYFQLDAGDLARAPDRQSALIALGRSMELAKRHCMPNTPCTLDYTDQSGTVRTLDYTLSSHAPIKTPVGKVATLELTLTAHGTPLPRLHALVSPALPGVLLRATLDASASITARLELESLTLDHKTR